MFNVLLLTSLNKDEFNAILEDYTVYLPLYTCISRTDETITEEDFLNKDLIILGIGDKCFNMQPYIQNLIDANINGTPVGFTHGTPVADPAFEDDESGIKKQEYNDFLTFFGITNYGGEYNFYNEIRIKNDYLSHDIFVGPIPLDLSGNISILETHDLGYTLNDDFQILLDNPNIPEGRNNFYLATWQPLDNRGRISHVNVGHNNYSDEEFYKPVGVEKNLLVNVCSWLLSLNPQPL